MEEPEIAIIDPNTLTCLGLKRILEEQLPHAIIRTFPGFGEFVDDTPDMYARYFISSQTYILYTAFFLPRREKTIILMDGTGGHSFPATNYILDLTKSEENLKREILRFFTPDEKQMERHGEDNDLSPREIEVLVLVSKGYINKEIAEKLTISLTTVVTHRKNIAEKLGIKSVSGLTIYAVMNGYLSPDSI
ncbi:MAG: LuxR C-terminal-related transcriptional regulator [Bacteroides sp.]|nr:LuxR C-terminal-related transcriptional regulator [Bacteroides sp.]